MKNRKIISSIVISLFLIINIPPIVTGQNEPNNSICSNDDPYPCHTFEEWRTFLLEYYGVTEEDLENINPEYLVLLNRETRIYHGWSNGTYTDEEKNQLLTEFHDSPSLHYGNPAAFTTAPYLYIDLFEYTDEEFDIRFFINSPFDFTHRVRAYLDYSKSDTDKDNDNKFSDGSSIKTRGPCTTPYCGNPFSSYLDPRTSFMHDRTRILKQQFDPPFGSLIDPLRYFHAEGQPDRLDSAIYFVVLVMYRWDEYKWYGLSDSRNGWYSYYKWKTFYTEIFYKTPFTYEYLKIVDDDTSPPILDIELIHKDNIQGRYINIDPEKPKLPIQICQTNGYTEDYLLAFIVNDKEDEGSQLLFNINGRQCDPQEVDWFIYTDPLDPQHFSLTQRYLRLMRLDNLGTNIVLNLNVRAKDGDTDRGDVDRSISSNYHFILDSGASLPPPFVFGDTELIADLEDVYPDPDSTYVDPDTGLDYTVIPYKKDTGATEIRFDLKITNTFTDPLENYPIRVLLKYSQLENSPKLSTQLNFNDFQIVRNGENGRTNIYEGFAYTDPDEVETNVFTNVINPNIYLGETGDAELWIEILPGEANSITIENFLSIKVVNPRLISPVLEEEIMDGVELFYFGLESLLSSAFDFYGPDMYFHSSYIADIVLDLYWVLRENEYIENLKVTSHFGVKIEKVYYPRSYDPEANAVIWNNNNFIDDPNTLKDMIDIHEDDRLNFYYIEETGYYTLRLLFTPTDEQIFAFRGFLYSFVMRDLMLILFDYLLSEAIQDMDLGLLFMSIICLAMSIAFNALMYHYLEIANGIDPYDGNYDEPADPALMETPTDLFPELLEDNELARKSLSAVENAYKAEQNFQGLYKSMNRYRSAAQDNEWNYASDQLLYASEFSQSAQENLQDFSTDTAYIMANISKTLNDKGKDPFSDSNLDDIRGRFAYDQNYLTCIERQANFRDNDNNDNSLGNTTFDFLDKNNEQIRELGLDATNSIPLSDDAEYFLDVIEENCISDSVNIQIDKLNQSILDDLETQQKIQMVKTNLLNAQILFNQGDYQGCVDILKNNNRYALDQYVITRNPEFHEVYYNGYRLLCKAQKYNQIHINILDLKSKQVINGLSIEYIFQVHNDVNYGMYYTSESIQPEFEIVGLPEDINVQIFYLDTTLLPQNRNDKFFIPLEREDHQLLRLLIDIPVNSPYESEIFTFYIKLSQDFIDKSISYNSEELELEVLDDDTTPPEIYIYEEEFGWSILIRDDDGVIDSEATGEYSIIDEHGNEWVSGILAQEEVLYPIEIPLKPGIYTLIVAATNNDLDRPGDEETSEDTVLIDITLADCYNYVDQQLKDLKNYVDDNLCLILSWNLREKLWLAQEYLRDAYELVEDGNITCGLFHDLIAQVLIEIVEFETELYNNLLLISDEDAEYIISALHVIRNNIVLLMGNSVDYDKGTDYGYYIALIEGNLFDLIDFIEEEINPEDRECLEDLITSAAALLEIAIFEISLDFEIECTLTLAQYTLDQAKDEVNYLFDSGKISQDLADILLQKIIQAQVDIEIVKNSI
ncbi:MAG: hypothetical protein ACTSQJ_05345 [Promethearchaeota archaeon]